MSNNTKTAIRRETLSKTVRDLRSWLNWTQPELATAIARHNGWAGKGTPETHSVTISRWERGVKAPSLKHRRTLAIIASRRGHKDLAAALRVPEGDRTRRGLLPTG